MKKILVLIMFVCMTLLVSCDNSGIQKNKYSFELDVVASPLRESIVFDYTLEDEENLLKNSEVSYSVSEKGSKTKIKSGTLTVKAEDGTGSVTVSSLTANTTYVATFTTGYKGKKVLLVEKEVTTSTKGTESDPYLITTATELKNAVTNDRLAYFELANDIDFNGEYIAPMCKASSTFGGHFNGKGYTIKNFKTGSLDSATSLSGTAYAGLFGYIGGKGVVENVNFDGVELYLTRSSSANVAIVAGYNCGKIDRVNITNSKVYFKGSSNKDYYVGMVAAYNADHASVTNCNVECDIELTTTTGSFIVGGVVGYNEAEAELPVRNIVDNCTFKGSINVTTSGTATSKIEMAIGGIIGRNFSTVKNCTSNATVAVKLETKKASTNSEDKTDIKEYRVLVGGIAGHNVNDSSVINNCNATASFDVDAKYAANVYVGGLVGQNGARKDSGAEVNNCSYTLTADASNTLHVLNHTADATVNAGLFGNNLAYANGNKTSDHSFTVNYYHFVEDTLELETTETINVEEITE